MLSTPVHKKSEIMRKNAHCDIDILFYIHCQSILLNKIRFGWEIMDFIGCNRKMKVNRYWPGLKFFEKVYGRDFQSILHKICDAMTKFMTNSTVFLCLQYVRVVSGGRH